MSDIILGEMQSRFADLIWENAPINSGKLAKLAEEELHWKKPTTYTVLRILCQKGLFRNEDSVVSPVMAREDYYLAVSRETIREGFGGSLPSFIAAFASADKLSEAEIAELEETIRRFRKGRQ